MIERYYQSQFDSTDNSAMIERLIVELNKSYMDPWSIASMAQYCHLSSDYFSHQFKENTGSSPIQFLYNLRIEKAKELLAEAGYPDGFSCRYHVGHMAVRQAYGEFFANALGQIGIDVEIVALDAATNSQALKVEHNFDIYTWGISATNGDIDYANRFFYTDNANNIFGYSDPEMDALIDAAAMEADSAKRSELNAEIQQKVLDECVIVPIYQQEDIHCYTSDLQGFRNGAFQAPLLKYCYFA